MKHLIYLGAISIALTAYGCEQNTANSASMDKDAQNVTATADTTGTIPAPLKNFLSKEQLQEQIDKEVIEALRVANDDIVEEAEDVVGKIRETIVLLLNNRNDEALKRITEAIGKAEVVTSIKPRLQLVPTSVDVQVNDFVADIRTVKQIQKEVEFLTDKGYLQAARYLLYDLASEINVTIANLPLVAYSDGLKVAAKLISDKQYDEAVVVLNSMLDMVVIEERSVPLPLIRAERMLMEMETLLAQKTRKDEILNMLDNAEYQIKFAEALGYGKKDREFGELYSAIKDIRKETEKAESGDSKNLSSKLREKLKAFKERISPKTSTQQDSLA